MKKITTAAFFTLLLLQTKAQSVSVNYIRHFGITSTDYITGSNFTPHIGDQVTVNYSHALGNSPINLNVAASRTRKWPPGPPRYIVKVTDASIVDYLKDSKKEASSVELAKSNTTSVDLLAGLGYVLPHTTTSKLFVTVNADFGVALNNGNTLNLYYNGNKTAALEQRKTQLIINPSMQAKYYFSKNIGLNLIAGYNNRGGFNAGAGIAARLGHRCLVCGGWHFRKGCRSRKIISMEE
jgi:hypothetical protein